MEWLKSNSPRIKHSTSTLNYFSRTKYISTEKATIHSVLIVKFGVRIFHQILDERPLICKIRVDRFLMEVGLSLVEGHCCDNSDLCLNYLRDWSTEDAETRDAKRRRLYYVALEILSIQRLESTGPGISLILHLVTCLPKCPWWSKEVTTVGLVTMASLPLNFGSDGLAWLRW